MAGASGPSLRRCLPGLLLLQVVAVGAQTSAAPPMPLEIHFRLLDAAGAAVAGEPLRLVVALGAGWQAAAAGHRATTDAEGRIGWSTAVALEQRQRKFPSNFFTQLASAPEPTVHVALGVELPYLDRRWLMVAAADHFPRGVTAQLDDLRLHGADAQGAFTQPASLQDGHWRLPGVPLALSSPGYRVVQMQLRPAAPAEPTDPAVPAGPGWSLQLVLQRLPAPVLR